MQQIDLIRDCCNKHPISDIVYLKVDVGTIIWLASQVHNMLELIDYQAARIAKLEADQGAPGAVDQLVKLYNKLDVTTNTAERERIIEQIRKMKYEPTFGKCSGCMCTSSDVDHCNDMYTSSHPGKFRPFMMAWCAMNGGI